MFDTTGMGYFEAKKGYEPDVAELNALLAKKNMPKTIKVSAVQEVDVEKHDTCYEVSVSGLG